MKSRKVGRFATWLLSRLGPRNEALSGDLLEEYELGQSDVWYIKEVVVAVVAGRLSSGWTTLRVVASAVAIGWSVILGGYLLLTLFDVPGHGATLFANRVSFSHVWIASGVFAPVIWATSGWVVSRFDRRHSRVAMIVFIASVVSPPVYWLVTVGSAAGADQMRDLAGLLPAYAAGVVLMPVDILIGGLSSFLPTGPRPT